MVESELQNIVYRLESRSLDLGINSTYRYMTLGSTLCMILSFLLCTLRVAYSGFIQLQGTEAQLKLMETQGKHVILKREVWSRS